MVGSASEDVPPQAAPDVEPDVRAPAGRPGAPRALAVLALAGALASGLFGAGFWLTHDAGPPAGAFPAAAEAVRARFEAGDLILLVPFYATRAREHLGDLHPVAPLDPLAEDLEVHPRVFVFGLFGEAERLRPRLVQAGLTLAETVAPSPGIVIDVWKNEATVPVAFDFVEHLPRARVWHEKDGTRAPCSEWSPQNGQGRAMGRWICPYDKEWFYVAPEWHRMGDHLRLCLWAHPPNQGRLVISFPDVPLGGRLVGRGGHTLNASVHAREAIFLDVQVGEALPQRFRFELTDHWRPFQLSAAGSGSSTVTFAVSSPDAGANHFCFAADLRGAPGGAR